MEVTNEAIQPRKKATEFTLPIGFQYAGNNYKTLPVAQTNGETELIYTKRLGAGKLYTWFGQVIAASVAYIGDEEIAAPFVSSQKRDTIPLAVRAIPLLDVGSLLLQIQRELWQPVINHQQQKCIHCGSAYEASAILHNIPVPEGDDGPITEFAVNLNTVIEINSSVEQLAKWNGHKYNHIVFRVPTLGDAIKHEGIARKEVEFWRNISFDCAVNFYYQEHEGAEKQYVPDGYMTIVGKNLFNKILDSETLKTVRHGLTQQLPSVRMYYSEPCPDCGEDTPLIAQVGYFFKS